LKAGFWVRRPLLHGRDCFHRLFGYGGQESICIGTILMVVETTIITPVPLKFVLPKKKPHIA